MMNTRPIGAFLLGLLWAIVVPSLGHAQNSNEAVPGLVPPQPKLRIQPDFPADPRTDGWVLYRYTIGPNGRLTDIESIDSFQGSFFGTPTRSALTKWIYKPATLNGRPVAWYGQQYLFDFIMLGNGLPLQQPKFKANAGEIQALLDAGDFAGAKSRATSEIEKISDIPRFIAFNILRAHAELGLGQKGAAANDLEQVQRFPVKEFIPAFRELFALEADLGHRAMALSIYGSMQDLQRQLIAANDKSVTVVTDAENARLKDIEQSLRSGRPAEVSGTISKGRWIYQPAGRAFTLTNVHGVLNSVTAHCRLVAPTQLILSSGEKTELPANSGACDLEFAGLDDTEVQLTEYFVPASQPPEMTSILH